MSEIKLGFSCLSFKYNIDKRVEGLGWAAGPRAAALAGVRGRSPRGIYNSLKRLEEAWEDSVNAEEGDSVDSVDSVDADSDFP